MGIFHVLLALILVLNLSTARAFDLYGDPPTGVWEKLPNPDESEQWTARPRGIEIPTRVTFVSYMEEGERKSFYVVLMQCGVNSARENEQYIIGYKNAAGLGTDCSGNTAPVHAIWSLIRSGLDPLPEEVKTIIGG